MPDNLYCDQTTPWQGVYFFTNTVIPPLQALNLSPLAQEVDLLPTRAEVYDISWVLHCFDVALPNQHTSLIDDSSNLNKVMKLLFCE